MSDVKPLAYEISGPEDAPVLVLGSSLGSDRHMWDEVMSHLAGWRVLRYDHPGHGRSEVLDLDRPARPDDLADAIEATIADAGVERYHLAGLSLGGMMALWMGLNRRERIVSVTMMSSGPVIEPSEQWIEKADMVRREGTAKLVDATMERWFTEPYRQANPPELERTRQTLRECSDEGYAQCCEVIAHLDCRPDFANLACPLNIIHAEHDGTLPPKEAGELAEALTEASGQEVSTFAISDASHMSAVEQPTQVANALRSALGI